MTVKLWLAHWLRKLAQHIDGERYVHAPRGTLSVHNLPADGSVVISTVGGGGSGGRFHVHKPPLTQEPSPWYAREFLGFDPEPRCIGGNLDSPSHAVECPAHMRSMRNDR